MFGGVRGGGHIEERGFIGVGGREVDGKEKDRLGKVSVSLSDLMRNVLGLRSSVLSSSCCMTSSTIEIR